MTLAIIWIAHFQREINEIRMLDRDELMFLPHGVGLKELLKDGIRRFDIRLIPATA